MSKWKGGPLPFKADAIETIWDERKCIYWIYRVEDKLYCRVRGSKRPYPISEPELIGTGYYGSGSVIEWADGFLNIFWPNKDAKKVMQKYRKASTIPDPSAGAVVSLDPKLRVGKMLKRFGYPIFICPTLIPTYGIEKSLDEDLWCERYLNRGAEGGHFNAMRFFSFGVWENFTISRVNFPYLKSGNKFDITKINPVWLETLKRRIGQCVERGFTVILTLTDNCSVHKKAGGWWNAHPWNGDNNVNGTSNWNGSIYHFYEDDKQSMLGIPESWEMIENFVRRIVRELDPLFKPNIVWEECNESHAGNGYHKLVRSWLKDEGVTEDWRVMTSMDAVYHSGHYPFLEFYKKQIHRYLNYAAHKIQDMDGYNWMDQEWIPAGVRFLASEDGLKPLSASNYRAFVKEILEKGTLGFESNIRPWWCGNVFNPDLFDWAVIKAIGDGWKDFLR